MVRSSGRTVALAAAVLAAGPGAALAGSGERWVEVRSPSFVVVSDGSDKDARRVLAQFEQVRALLQEVWPGARVDDERPVTILAVRDEDGLRALLPAYWERKNIARPAGVAVSAPDRSWSALRMDVADFREEDDTWDNPYLVPFHEYVHVVLRLNFPSLPAWLNEGLAEFWGNTIIQGDKVYEGRYVPYHLATLRQRAPLPLPVLFAVDHGSPSYSEQNRATLFYAQSWALVHFLVLGSDARRGQINRLGALLREGRPQADALREAFGDLAALDREFQAYVRQTAFRYRRRTVRLAVQAGTGSRPLPEAEALAVRASFHVATGRPVEAEALARRATARDPALAAPHEALALGAWREGRTAEALEHLRRATALPGASDFAHDLFGHLAWQAGGEDALASAEAAFRRAIELNPRGADAHSALAMVRAQRGAPLTETVPLAVKAAQLEPGEIDYTLTALRLAARGGEVEEVRRRAAALAANVSGDDRVKAQALVSELDLLRGRVSVRADAHGTCPQGEPSCVEAGHPLAAEPGTAVDPAKAARIYEGACATGMAEPCGRLGSLLRVGHGVGKDARRALALLTRACNAGWAFACGELGLLLREGGPGVPADGERARAMLRRACDGGDAPSCATAGP